MHLPSWPAAAARGGHITQAPHSFRPPRALAGRACMAVAKSHAMARAAVAARLETLHQDPELVRNICILAHVDHGDPAQLNPAVNVQ